MPKAKKLNSPIPGPDVLDSLSSLSVNNLDVHKKSLPSFLVPVILKFPSLDVTIDALLDSGATANFLSTSILSEIPLSALFGYKPSDKSVSLANGQRLPISGEVKLPIQVNSSSGVSHSSASFFVTQLKYDAVLGLPWLCSVNPVIDWKNLSVQFRSVATKPSVISLSALVDTPASDVASSEEDVEFPLPPGVPSEYAKFASVFYEPKNQALPPHRPYDLEIKLKDPNKIPPALPLYHLSHKEQQVLKGWIDENLAKGFIRPSNSPAAAPIFFTKKKDGSLRPCIDYRALNANTVPDKHPLSLISHFLDRVAGSTCFTKLDLKGAFNLIRMKQGDEWKAAFRCVYGHYEPLVVQFGETNGPAVCQRMMTELLKDFIDLFVVVYLDDILIFSKDLEEHKRHVASVLERLMDNKLIVKASKCLFHCPEVTFLGFVISSNGISADPEKVDAVQNFPVPWNLKSVRSFLGLINFYRRFIPDFSKLALPLTKLTKKNAPFIWTDDCQLAFETLRNRLTQDVTLPHIDPDAPFYLATDASDLALGAVLSQPDSSGQIRPVAFYSRKLTGAEINYTVYDKELLGIVEAFKNWRPYLVSSPHTIQVSTDHKNLVYFNTRRHLKPRHARWSEILSEFDFVLSHLPGAANAVADALSRVEKKGDDSSDDQNDLILLPNENWTQEDTLAPMEVTEDTEWPELVAHFLANDEWPEHDFDQTFLDEQVSNFEIRDERLYYKDSSKLRLYAPKNQRTSIFKRFHEGLGHLASKSIEDLITHRFWWPQLLRDLKDYIARCPQCQLNRRETSSVARAKQKPLRPLPPVALPFERLGLDFIQNLPRTQAGNQHIITAIDYGTRWVIAKAVPQMTTAEVVKFLYHDILMNFGCPFEIITDRASSFLSEALKEFESVQRIRHLASTPYHPQTNGMVERMHAMLGHSISTLTNAQPQRWDEFLDQTIFSLRVRTHSVTRYSPFYLLYGVDPRLPGDTGPPRESMMPLDELEQQEVRREFTAREFDQLGMDRAAAYHRSVAQAERIRNRLNLDPDTPDHYFSIGDLVKMKHHSKEKFEFAWKGPYHIVQLGHPGTYWLMTPRGNWLDSTVNQNDLAPWTATTTDNEDYFYDGTSRQNEPPAPNPRA